MFMGLKPYELLTLLGIVTGPVIAVAITIVSERMRRDREQQIQTLRLLISSRTTPADPRWNIGISLIPLEFRRNSKVIAKWRAYLEVVNTLVSNDQAEIQGQRSGRAQAAMIYEISKSLGIPLSEGDVHSTAYVSRGFTDRDALYLDSLKATRDIASAVERSAIASETLVGRLPNDNS